MTVFLFCSVAKMHTRQRSTVENTLLLVNPSQAEYSGNTGTRVECNHYYFIPYLLTHSTDSKIQTYASPRRKYNQQLFCTDDTRSLLVGQNLFGKQEGRRGRHPNAIRFKSDSVSTKYFTICDRYLFDERSPTQGLRITSLSSIIV